MGELLNMPGDLEQAYDACRRRNWAQAYHWLSLADRQTPLEVVDLERLATAAYLVGRDDDYLSAMDRAHQAWVSAGESRPAARCAFWCGLSLLFRGEAGHAGGWFARAQRLLGKEDCVEQGYLQLPVAEQQLRSGEPERARETATASANRAERFRDPDLLACARHLQGRARLAEGDLNQGLALLDETMITVVAGELSPIVTGLVYCSVIDACQEVYALDRAREWTRALAHWCESQPEMVSFTSTCLVHRAEILQSLGEWPHAFEEAKRACRRDKPSGGAWYQQGEVHRLRGDYREAEVAYEQANQLGVDPQPGLSLLRLAQGRKAAASAGIRRALSVTSAPLHRAKLLPACVEINLAAGEIDAAQTACDELQNIADRFTADALSAMAAQSRGAVALVAGDTVTALASLRNAARVWQELDLLYPYACTRLSIARACDALGDDDGCRLESAAALATFERLGARPDISKVDELATTRHGRSHHNLTPRQLEVLRLVAAGKTNKAIAAELSLSQKTVDRHLSNIFDALDVVSRAAATAYACREKLV